MSMQLRERNDCVALGQDNPIAILFEFSIDVDSLQFTGQKVIGIIQQVIIMRVLYS